jgi:hypothetical protein
MILIGVFTLAMVVGMPYLMDNCKWLFALTTPAHPRSGPRSQGRIRGNAEEEYGNDKLSCKLAQHGFGRRFGIMVIWFRTKTCGISSCCFDKGETMIQCHA